MSVLEKPIFTAKSHELIPPLENGDRLRREEFERRYSAMPHVKKAELVEGVVYMGSPVRHRHHAKPHVALATWLGYYVARTPGLKDFGDNGTVRLDDENEFQPDLMLLLPTHAGGRAHVDEEDYVTGPPELVCEVASSSVSMDLHAKLDVYLRSGVREYLVWRSDDGAAQWFILRGGRYEELAADEQGVLKSECFGGLWLDAAALRRGDLPAVLAAVDLGTSSAAHGRLIEKLKQ